MHRDIKRIDICNPPKGIKLYLDLYESRGVVIGEYVGDKECLLHLSDDVKGISGVKVRAILIDKNFYATHYYDLPFGIEKGLDGYQVQSMTDEEFEFITR